MPEGVAVEYPIEVVWEGGRRYRGGPPAAEPVVLDGDRAAGPSPVDSLLVAMASCSAIDIVDYLEKRRTPAAALRAVVRFSRAATPPKRLTAIDVVYHVATEAPQEQLDRAAQLSFDRYCSVTASFAPDVRITWRVERG